ncbi:unnamed protein product [Blepharisma stoltei]|uniref:Uncharacterized protein n=1 Tax=Blepharisma stoltei TaxID=1481888 RepID=A0AAU9K1D3_9CILI|nr:unnamed protein product [Blepharisma stoltei]
MELIQCFEPGCKHEAYYTCYCTSPGTLCCNTFLIKFIKQIFQISVLGDLCSSFIFKVTNYLAKKYKQKKIMKSYVKLYLFEGY